MKEEINLFKNAYQSYNLDIREDIDNRILIYIKERLIENKDFLEQLISITKENVSYEEIIETFCKVSKIRNIYKKEKEMKLNQYGFVSNIYSTSVGLIAVETSNPLLILEYFVMAIKSRNSIVISDLEFEEESVKGAIWIIFSEALKKFNVDPNIINIYPYEECNYELFDKVIITDEKIIRDIRKTTNEIYIYIENDFFEEEALKECEKLKSFGKKPIVIRNSLEDTIEKINVSKGFASCIYTRDPKIGYKFINLVRTDNVFVNSSISDFSEPIPEHKNPLYSNKKIMFELGSIKESVSQGQSVDNTFSSQENDFNNINNFQLGTDEELGLITTDYFTPWYKKIYNKLIAIKDKLFGKTIEE